MIRKAKTIWRTLKNQLPRKEYVKVSNSTIPSRRRRWCGREFKDDDFYLKSAEAEAHRLLDKLRCSKESRVFDVGCGQGRLAIGLLRVVGSMSYLGMDVDRRSIEWCKRHIEREHPSFRFRFLDLYNERYNAAGMRIDDKFHFPVADNSIDAAYLYSVFSHTTENDLRAYLTDFVRILPEGGRVFFTAFVEEAVPDFSLNPEGYRLQCSGPLHVVRYNKDHLFSIIRDLGYSIADFEYGTESDGQSAVYLSRGHRGSL